MAEVSREFSNSAGSAIRPVYADRQMKCYAVTESELKNLGLANLGVTGTFGIGSALFAFGLDLFKDASLAAEIPTDAAVLVDAIQPLCIWLGVAFWVFSGALWVWRKSMLDIIKSETNGG